MQKIPGGRTQNFVDPECAARVTINYLECVQKAYGKYHTDIDTENKLHTANLEAILKSWRSCRTANKCDDLFHSAEACTKCDNDHMQQFYQEGDRYANALAALKFQLLGKVPNESSGYDPNYPFGQEIQGMGNGKWRDGCTCCTEANNDWRTNCASISSNGSSPKPKPVPYPTDTQVR